MTNNINTQKTVSPPGGGKMDTEWLKRVQDYCNQNPSNANGLLIDLALSSGYDVPQLEALEKWCTRNNFIITDYQVPVLQVLYAQIENNRLHRTSISNLIQELNEYRTEALTSFDGTMAVRVERIIKDFSERADTQQKQFVDQLASVNALVKSFDPKGDLPPRFAEAVLNGVDTGISKQADEFTGRMEKALTIHETNFQRVNARLHDLVVAQADEIKKLQAIKATDLANPIMTELAVQIQNISDSSAEAFDQLTAASIVKFENNVTSLVGNTQRNLAKEELAIKKAIKEMTEHVEKMKNQIENRFWIEWVRIAGITFVMFCTAQWFVNLRWTYNFFH